MIRLSIHEKSTSGAQAEPEDREFEAVSITLGRDQACDVVLPRQAVSRQHARITIDRDLGFIEDLGSSFGTQVNGEALNKGEKRLLKTGDLIVIAQFDITFSQERAIPEPVGENTSYVSRAMVRGALRGVLSAEDPYFRFMNTEREGDRVPISEAQELIVGRDAAAEIRLSDDLVSRRHAKLRRDLAGVHVEDLDSRNGIKVNKRKVRHRTLKDRDEVEVGAARLLFVDPNALGEAPKVEVPRSPSRPPVSRREASVVKPAPSAAAPAAAEASAVAKKPAAAPAEPEAAAAPAPPPEPEAPAPSPEASEGDDGATDAAEGENAEGQEERFDEDEASVEEGSEEGWEGQQDGPDAGPEEYGDGAAALRIGGIEIPGGSQTVIMAGLGLVGLFALIMMIALLVGA